MRESKGNLKRKNRSIHQEIGKSILIFLRTCSAKQMLTEVALRNLIDVIHLLVSLY